MLWGLHVLDPLPGQALEGMCLCHPAKLFSRKGIAVLQEGCQVQYACLCCLAVWEENNRAALQGGQEGAAGAGWL